MNERIKRILEQADISLSMTEFSGCLEGQDYLVADSNLSEMQLEKFAELIAQECARLAMTQHCSTSPADYGDMEPYEQGCDDTASRISGLIRRTFGVKE
jgi:hypothetical protein